MSISSIATASDIQMDYMKLLVTQLQNQNPLEPMNNQEMASQLAQFSQLQQLETMNSSFADILVTVKHTYATSLIGREISFIVETDTGEFKEMNGTVEGVFNDPKGGNLLVVKAEDGSDYTLNLDGIISVKN